MQALNKYPLSFLPAPPTHPYTATVFGRDEGDKLNFSLLQKESHYWPSLNYNLFAGYLVLIGDTNRSPCYLQSFPVIQKPGKKSGYVGKGFCRFGFLLKCWTYKQVEKWSNEQWDPTWKHELVADKQDALMSECWVYEAADVVEQGRILLELLDSNFQFVSLGKSLVLFQPHFIS